MMHQKKIYPINLIPKGRKCLLVGGGKVASRKVSKLLEAGFNVTVLAPQISESILRSASNNPIRIIRRRFESRDLDESYFIVFAATDDRCLNRLVLSECHARGLLCSAIDENWADGDFITPASFEKNGINVAVSSSGTSCRRSKMIKNNLAKHIVMISGAELLIVGTDFKLLPLEKREKIQTTGESAETLYSMLAHIWGLHEFTLVQTCNRIELISVACPTSKGLLETLKRILKFEELGADSCYVKTGWEAFKHLSFVLAGLKSQSVGEKNIVSQVKKSVSQAISKGWAGSMTRELCDSALHISKHIRNYSAQKIKGGDIHDLCADFL